MIFIYNDMIIKFKIFENNKYRTKEIGDYVKLRKSSGFKEDFIINNIYKIVDKYIDNEDGEYVVFFKIESVLDNVKLNSVAPHNVYHISDEEKEEIEIKLNSKKYNL